MKEELSRRPLRNAAKRRAVRDDSRRDGFSSMLATLVPMQYS